MQEQTGWSCLSTEVGWKQEDENDCRTSFDVIYEEGTIEAISYDAQNREIARNVLYTGGERNDFNRNSGKKKRRKQKSCVL